MLYLAYGSNLDLDRMLWRCPAAKPVSACTLKDWTLTFRNVADIVPKKNGTVVGALYDITPACELALDVYEGFRAAAPSRGLYRKEWVQVRDERGRWQRAMVYVMNRGGYGSPNGGYLDIIAQGYKDWGLDFAPLLKALRAVERYEASLDRMVLTA